MATMTFQVPGVSCGHCVNAVTHEVSALDGVTTVEVDLATKLVTVAAAVDVTAEQVIAAIHEAGYDEVTAVSAS